MGGFGHLKGYRSSQYGATPSVIPCASWAHRVRCPVAKRVPVWFVVVAVCAARPPEVLARPDTPGTVERLRAAALEAGHYLARMTRPSGRFRYKYQARSGADGRGYNMLRHAGTIYAMAQLLRMACDPTIRAATVRALRYLMEHVHVMDNGAATIVHRGATKLGGAALALLAMTEYVRATGDRRWLTMAQRLALFVTESQRADGSFVHKRYFPSGESTGFVSRYYPGEAVFALMRLYTLDGGVWWRTAAERSANYLITIRDAHRAQLDHDHWLLYGLNELHKVAPRQIYRDHALRIADAIAGARLLSSASLLKNPRTTPISTRIEGLLATHELAMRVAPEAAPRLRRVIDRGIAFLQRHQLVGARAHATAEPHIARGGMPKAPGRLTVRIDYVQHALSALLGAYVLETGAPARSRCIEDGL